MCSLKKLAGVSLGPYVGPATRQGAKGSTVHTTASTVIDKLFWTWGL